MGIAEVVEIDDRNDQRLLGRPDRNAPSHGAWPGKPSIYYRRTTPKQR